VVEGGFLMAREGQIPLLISISVSVGLSSPMEFADGSVCI
jgi:hypothetical protein